MLNRICFITFIVTIFSSCRGENGVGSESDTNELRLRLSVDPYDEKAFKALINIVEDESSGIAEITNSLLALSSVANQLPNYQRIRVLENSLKAAGSDKWPLRRLGFQALTQFASRDDLLPDIVVNGLQQRNTDIALFAAKLVTESGFYNETVIAQILKNLEEKGFHEKPLLETKDLIRALGSMESYTPEVLSIFDRLSTSSKNRFIALEALKFYSRAKTLDDRHYSFLKLVLNSKGAMSRYEAMKICFAIVARDGLNDPRVSEFINMGLNDDDPAVRMIAESTQRIYKK